MIVLDRLIRDSATAIEIIDEIVLEHGAAMTASGAFSMAVVLKLCAQVDALKAGIAELREAVEKGKAAG